MTVGELIEKLKLHDENKRVFIQQGEEFDYMEVESVEDKELIDANTYDDEIINCVVINYT